MTDSIGRHLEAIFDKGNPPAGQNHRELGIVLELQMAIPGKRHEHVRNRQQRDGLHRTHPSFF
jgi:hypothetical protein